MEMSTTMSRIRATVSVAALAAALGWGASAALAAPPDAAACTPPQSACTVSAQCAAYCFPRGGFCNFGCCACNR
jgi:hypothetical protein